MLLSQIKRFETITFFDVSVHFSSIRFLKFFHMDYSRGSNLSKKIIALKKSKKLICRQGVT